MLQELACRQQARGRQVQVLTLSEGPEQGPNGVAYRRLSPLGAAAWPMARGLHEAIPPDAVVHVHGVDGLLDQVVWRMGLGPRTGVSTHGAYFHTQRWSRLKTVLAQTATRAVLSRAGAVWFTSAADQRLLSGVAGEVLSNGVDTQRWSKVKRRPRAGEWLVWGRVDVHKGLHLLLAAVAELARQGLGPSVLHIVGPEARPGLLRALAEQALFLGISERVKLYGAVEEHTLFDLIGGCERAIFPSQHEGFGLTVVEAMAAGAPVVVSDIEVFRDKVAHGIHGALVDFRSPLQAAVALRAWLRKPAEGTVAAAREQAEIWSWDAVVPRYDRAYAALGGAQ